MSDYQNDLQSLQASVAPGGVYYTGEGYIDPRTGQRIQPNGAQYGMPTNAAVGQPYMPGPGMGMPPMMPAGAQPGTPQPPAQQPQQQPPQAPAGGAAPAGGSMLARALGNPLVGTLLGAGLGAIGGGRQGAVGGGLGGAMLGANAAKMINAAQQEDPNTSLAALSARYLPLLAASYAGAFYKNPTAPQYGRPADQAAHLAPTHATQGTPGKGGSNWYTYGDVPNYSIEAHASGGMQGDGPPAPQGSLAGAMSMAPPSGHFVQGPGDGTSDDVNAKLSNSEYVVPAHIVAAIGNGSSDAGAKALDRMQVNVRKRVGKQMAKGQHPKRSPPPETYMNKDFEP